MKCIVIGDGSSVMLMDLEWHYIHVFWKLLQQDKDLILEFWTWPKLWVFMLEPVVFIFMLIK